jgi:hypothetical protein
MSDDTTSHYRETSESKVEAIGGRFGYAWITLAFFLFSFVGHWLFGWFSFVSEQRQHNQPIEVTQYVVQMSRDTLENWQSEFLQLLWQVGGLAWLLYIGSPQSKEGDERKEAKLDAILRKLDPQEADALIARLDREFHRT